MQTPPDLIEQINHMPIHPNSLALWGLGQMGFIVKGSDAVVYIDPCLSDIVESLAGDAFRRQYPPPVLPENITNADYVLISHEHPDHLDPHTLEPLAQASPQAVFITNGWCRPALLEIGISADRILTPEALTPFQVGQTSLRLTLVPSAHYEKTYDPEKGYRWLGFLLEWNGVTLYHSGDTIIYDDYLDTMRKLPTPDIAIAAANGRDYFRDEQQIMGNLLPMELARLAHDLEWGLVLPGHNDLYAPNTIPYPTIVEAVYAVHPRQRLKLLQPGELLYFVK